MRIVYWAHHALARPAVTKKLEAVKDVDWKIVETLDELKKEWKGLDGMIAPDPHDFTLATELGKMLNAPDNTVRWIHCITAGREGFEHAGIPANVVLTGPAGAHSATLAEHAMAFILNHTRQISTLAAVMKNKAWERNLASRTSSVENATLCIIGFGYAGKELAKRAKAFNMKIVAVTRTARPDPLADEVVSLDKLKEVLPRADFIAVTIAQKPETHHLLSTAEFAVCKKTAFVVNVARGPIIDSAALLDALKTGKIAAAGIDVTDPEPLPPGDPLWDAPNLIITPHFGGGGSPVSQDRLAGRATENLAKFVAGTVKPT